MKDFMTIQVVLLAITTVIFPIIAWAFSKWVVPWLIKTGNEARAKEIALVADRLTDELVNVLPNAKWADLIDKLIDKLIVELDVKPVVAKREAISQLRKRMFDKE